MYKLLIIAGLSLTLLAACGGAPAIDPQSIGDPDKGRQIFENGTEIISKECAGCHTLDGVDFEDRNSGPFPSLLGIAERAGDRAPGLSAVEYLRQSIVDPAAFIVEGYEDGMEKGYKYGLSEEEVDDLVAFLLTQ